jgi:hypothetical protein
MKTIKNMSKKLIILSIVLLTSLSTTVLNNFPKQTKKEAPVKTETAKKIKLFNVKNYLEEYEHKKKSKEMLELSLKRNIPEN